VQCASVQFTGALIINRSRIFSYPSGLADLPGFDCLALAIGIFGERKYRWLCPVSGDAVYDNKSLDISFQFRLNGGNP
jgi:hypothetical protein